MNNDTLPKINVNNTDVNVILKSLQKITNSKEKISTVDSSLEMINGKIISEINNSSSSINDLTVSNIGDQYVFFLKEQNIEDKSFLVVSDGNFDAKVFSQVFASYLKVYNIKVFFTSINETSNFGANFSNMNESFGGMICFSLHRFKKNFLSISFLNENGAFLSQNQSDLFNRNSTNTLDLNLRVYDEKIDLLPLFDVDNYISTLPLEQNLSNLEISINNSYNMNSEIIHKFFNRNQIKYVETKNSNPNTNKNIKKAIFSSIRKKHDVAISLFSGNNYFEMAVRHKKQYKFFNMNDLSAIYLYYQTKYLQKDKDYWQDKYIVSNISTSDLVSEMAKKNKIKMKEYQIFYSEIYTNKDLDSKMLFATNGTNYFISEGQKNYISDPFYNLQIFLEMISFFKSQNKSLYDIMVEIIAEYGVFRHSINEQIIDDATARKFFNILSKDMKLADQKIIRFDKINTNNNNIKIFKVILADKTKVSFVHSKRTNSLKIYLSLKFIEKKEEFKKSKKIISLDNNDNYMNLIIQEKKIVEAIKLFKDDYSKKNFNWKDFVKYFIFVGIFISIFVILFTTLYSVTDQTSTIFDKINKLIQTNNLLMYLLPFILLMFMFPIICNSILIGRMLKIQGQKVKIRHLIISSSIAVVISNITPLSVGGDIASYWYLKRKSFERESLIATFLASSLLYQVVGALIALIFIPMGLFAYSDILFSGSAESTIIIIMVLIGFTSNIIAASFIAVFSFSRRAQSLFIKSWIKLIEFNPFIVSRDSSFKAASFKYAFLKIRTSSFIIFKNLGVTLEFIFWRILPYFVNLGAILAISTGLMKPNDKLWGGQYINFIIGFTILSSANTLSPTPGGSGTTQWLQTQIYEQLFDTKYGSVDEISKIFSLLSTLLFFIVPTILSGLLLTTIWIGEKRIDKYTKVKRIISYENITTQNRSIRKYTRFYKISFVLWIFMILSAILIYYLIYTLFM